MYFSFIMAVSVYFFFILIIRLMQSMEQLLVAPSKLMRPLQRESTFRWKIARFSAPFKDFVMQLLKRSYASLKLEFNLSLVIHKSLSRDIFLFTFSSNNSPCYCLTLTDFDIQDNCKDSSLYLIYDLKRKWSISIVKIIKNMFNNEI